MFDPKVDFELFTYANPLRFSDFSQFSPVIELGAHQSVAGLRSLCPSVGKLNRSFLLHN